jgi:hypothetical protein
MFAGHFALACAAKRLAPRTSLGTLIVAAQFLDLLWPWLIIAGVEQVSLAPAGGPYPLVFDYYPWSHSLVMAILWGLAFGSVYGWVRKDWRAAGVVGLLVVSHWFLDFLTHFPDLPVAPNTTARYGLGLWGFPKLALAVELLCLAGGVAIYLVGTRAIRAAGNWGFAALIAFIGVTQVASTLGPPPPSPDAVAWSGTAMWLLVLWAWWSDRSRTAR